MKEGRLTVLQRPRACYSAGGTQSVSCFRHRLSLAPMPYKVEYVPPACIRYECPVGKSSHRASQENPETAFRAGRRCPVHESIRRQVRARPVCLYPLKNVPWKFSQKSGWCSLRTSPMSRRKNVSCGVGFGLGTGGCSSGSSGSSKSNTAAMMKIFIIFYFGWSGEGNT